MPSTFSTYKCLLDHRVLMPYSLKIGLWPIWKSIIASDELEIFGPQDFQHNFGYAVLAFDKFFMNITPWEIHRSRLSQVGHVMTPLEIRAWKFIDQFHNMYNFLLVNICHFQLHIFQFWHHDKTAFSISGRMSNRYRYVGAGYDAVWFSAAGGKIINMN